MSFKELVASGLIIYIFVSLILRSRYPRIPIWALMSFAAFISTASGLVPFEHMGAAVDLEVILFLIGMFSIVALAETSGLLDALAYWFISRFKTRYSAIIGSAFLFGLLAAFAVNDTVALMGPPIAYSIAKALGIDPRMMFLLLAFSLTIGSVTTPIGNPQNMLIAVESGIKAPFIEFLKWLAIPTLVNIYITALYLTRAFGVRDEKISIAAVPSEKITCRRDAVLGGLGLIVVPAALLVNDIAMIMGLPHIEHIGFIPFIVAAALYIASSSPRRVLERVDWGTIIFFITMFITMEGVWRAGILQKFLDSLPVGLQKPVFWNISAITISSILFSQALSNVPFTKFYIDYMKAQGFTSSSSVEWITLAMAATIAGNLTVLGAASNIIVIETLESRYNSTITFKEFFKHGVVITAVNTLLYLSYIYALLILTQH